MLGVERWKCEECGKELPLWPSLNAVVESADMDVVVEFGVPLENVLALTLPEKQGGCLWMRCWLLKRGETHGMSVGVSGLEGGSGMLIKVGVFIVIAC